MFKQIKKLFIALVLVFSLCLVACGECPECEELPDGLINPDDCPDHGYITKDECPTCAECPEFNTDKECADAGWVKECEEGFTAPTKVEMFVNDLSVGESAKFETEVTPANAYTGLYWSTSDPSIATVDNEGNVTGVKPGKVTITVTSVLNPEATVSEEIEIAEDGDEYEIASRESAAIIEQLSSLYVTGDFDLPLPWNQSVKVTYTDANGNEIERFVLSELGALGEGETSKKVVIKVSVEYGDQLIEENVSLQVVKVAEGYNDFEKVNKAVEYAEMSIYEYIDGATKVSGNLSLPTTGCGVALKWSSDKTYVLTAAGVFTRPNNDTEVTLSVSPSTGAASQSKKFKLVAKGYTKDEKLAYLTKSGDLSAIANGKFAGTIGLPEKDSKFGIHLSYTSSNQDAISNDGVISQSLTVNTKVTFTVTAVYNDANSASDAFVEVFTFDVTAASNTPNAQMVSNFANDADHAQFKHVPYGMQNNNVASNEATTYVIDPTEAESLSGYTFSGDSSIFNIKKNADGSLAYIELVAQYFRYHEANLKVTYGSGDEAVSYVWTLNVGIGAENDIVYIGGRMYTTQTSTNVNEVADVLQGFSKWDSYVGIVSSASERNQQQWSKFSGYTFYVDVPTGEKEVVFTKDKEGNVTATPSSADEKVRYQYYVMEFSVTRFTVKTVYVDTNNDGKGDTAFNLAVVSNPEKATIRGNYGGNFDHFYINDSAVSFDLPIATYPNGYHTDGNAVVAKYGLTVEFKASTTNGGAASAIYDYTGSAYKLARESSFSLDGYRVGFVIEPVVSEKLEEAHSATYKFKVGTQLALENPYGSANNIQNSIPSDLHPVWGTPYVTIPAYGMAFGSQTNGGLTAKISALGGAYITGADMSLPVTVERYYRHAQNEAISAPVVSDIKAYLKSLLVAADEENGATTYNTYIANDKDSKWVKKTSEAAFISELAAKIEYTDISKTVLDEIEALYTRYNALYSSWKAKDDVKQAGALLEAIKDAAASELAKQGIVATLIAASYAEIEDALEALKTKSADEIKAGLADTTLTAKINSANLHYNSLSEGLQKLYANGYTSAHFTYAKHSTAYILEAYNLEKSIIELSEVVSNTATVEKVYFKLYPQKEKSTNSAFAGESLITNYSKNKIGILYEDVCAYLNVKLDSTKINEQKTKYNAITDEARKTIIKKSFTAYKTTTYTDDVLSYFDYKLNAAQAAKDKTVAEAKEASVKLAKEIKDLVADLPTNTEFKRGEFTAEQEKTLKKLVVDTWKNSTTCNYDSKVSQLVTAYMTITDGSRPAADNTKTAYKDVNKAIIDLLVAGISTAEENTVGDFSAEGERDILEKLFDRYENYDRYVGLQLRSDVKEFDKTDITVDDKAAVSALKKRWNALTNNQKAFANEDQTSTVLEYITELENAITRLENIAKVQYLIDEIENLPSKKEVTLEDRETVKAVIAKVAALETSNPTLYAYIDEDSVDYLEELGDKVESLFTKECENSEAYELAVEAFEKNAESENGFTGVVNKDTKAAAEALLAAYNAMNALEKEYFASQHADYQLLVEMTSSALKVYNQYAAN